MTKAEQAAIGVVVALGLDLGDVALRGRIAEAIGRVYPEEAPAAAPRLPGLTPKQLAILQEYDTSARVRGVPPTLQEISDAIGVTKVTVWEHVMALVKKGYIVRGPRGSRCFSVAPGVVVHRDAPVAVVP